MKKKKLKTGGTFQMTFSTALQEKKLTTTRCRKCFTFYVFSRKFYFTLIHLDENVMKNGWGW